LRITVRDSAGLSVRRRVTVVSEANDVSPVGGFESILTTGESHGIGPIDNPFASKVLPMSPE